jgi:hypothetical protein
VVFVFRSVFVQLNGKAAAWVEGNSMLFAVLCKKCRCQKWQRHFLESACVNPF